MSIARRILLGGLGAVVLVTTSAFAYVNFTYKRDFSHCSACHGNGESTNKHELPADAKDLRGGYVIDAGPFGVFYPKNLTSDPETGIGKLSDSQLARAIRHGVSHSGELAAVMSFAVGPMSDEDLAAVVSYLRTLPPIKNVVPRDEWGVLAKAVSSKFNPRAKGWKQ